MKPTSLLVCLTLGLMLSGCDSQPSGLLQQRIAELEAECAASRKRADQIQSKLDAKENAPPKEAVPLKTEDKQSDDSKNRVASAALLTAESLRGKVMPGMLQVYEEAAWAGFRVEKSGESRGVAVPFFRDHEGQWICGWSERQIIEVLDGQTGPSVSAAVPPPATSLAPQTGLRTEPSAPPVQPAAPAPAAQLTRTSPAAAGSSKPPASASGASATFFVDPNTGKLYRIKSDGSREAVPESR